MGIKINILPIDWSHMAVPKLRPKHWLSFGWQYIDYLLFVCALLLLSVAIYTSIKPGVTCYGSSIAVCITKE